MCQKSAVNDLKISVCVDFGFYLRRQHGPHCVLFSIALQQIVYRILYREYLIGKTVETVSETAAS